MSWIFWLGLSLVICWGVLIFRWHGFWRMDTRLPPAPAMPPHGKWPAVKAIVPARNEEKDIAAALTSLLAQDYPGAFRIICVNDNSTDATADKARALAGDDRLTVLDAPPPQPGWAGKVAAQHFALESLKDTPPEFIWFTDADITHAPDTLRRLVALAQARKLGLTSVMVRLRCESTWEKLLVPAYVYNFFLLYPPKAVSRPDAYAAGAAGGCILARHDALVDIGGLESIHDAIIDDCTLARRIKDRGWRLWLGLSDTSRSLRAYDRLGEFWTMVARFAYEQLDHSPIRLAGALAAVGYAFILPALYVPGFILGAPLAHFPGLVAFGLMTASYLPILRFYRLRKPWALLLPLAEGLFALMTLSSAISHMTGKGVNWRGRPVS